MVEKILHADMRKSFFLGIHIQKASITAGLWEVPVKAGSLQPHIPKDSSDVYIVQYSTVYFLLVIPYMQHIIRRAAVLPGGQRQCAGSYNTVATEVCPDTEAARKYIHTCCTSGSRWSYYTAGWNWNAGRRELKGGASASRWI